jgi:hypothetical protein
MSCCNTCGSTQGCNCQYTVVLPDNPVEAYTCANINLTGIGVYDSQNGNEFDFRGITSGNNSLLVTLDAGNNTILLTFNIQQIIDDLPDATTTQRGVLETATDAEAIGKALDNKILTPSNLAAIGATTTFSGLIEIATNAEALTGASTSLAITPANLAYVNAAQLTTRVFADAVARAAAVADFIGQFGCQSDTTQPYYAWGLGAGEWGEMLSETGLNTATFTMTGGQIDLSNNSNLYVGNGVDTSYISVVSGAKIAIGAGAILDLSLSSLLQISSASVPANSVITTSGLAGNPSSKLINTFISTSNTQAGYTAFANGATLRTCDTATVTLPQLAQIVGTLIEDLKAVKLPAT